MEKDRRAYHNDKYNVPYHLPRNNFARISRDSSFMNNMECFKCNNIGHMDRDCNMTWVPNQAKNMNTKKERKVTQVWRRNKIGLESLLNTEDINSCC